MVEFDILENRTHFIFFLVVVNSLVGFKVLVSFTVCIESVERYVGNKMVIEMLTRIY